MTDRTEREHCDRMAFQWETLVIAATELAGSDAWTLRLLGIDPIRRPVTGFIQQDRSN